MHSDLYSQDGAKESRTAGLAVESTHSECNSGVAVLGVKINYVSKSYNHTVGSPFRTLSSERLFFFLFFNNEYSEREIYLTLVPYCCVLNTSFHSAIQDLKVLC